MNTVSPAYFEIIDFIAAGTTPEAVAHFRPSPEAQQRVAELVEREKEYGLSLEEQAELDHFMERTHPENGQGKVPPDPLACSDLLRPPGISESMWKLHER